MLVRHGKALAMASLGIILLLQLLFWVHASTRTRKLTADVIPPIHEPEQVLAITPITAEAVISPPLSSATIPAISVKPFLDPSERVPGGKVRKECESLKVRMGYSDSAKDNIRDLR
jgi:hypothetical protein